MKLLYVLLAAAAVVAIAHGSVALAAPEALSAGFETTESHGFAPFTAGFEDHSTGNATGWQWSFGDGSGNATGRIVEHTYYIPGTYTVILTATDGSRNSSASTNVTADPSLFACFATNTLNQSSLQEVQFYDTSTGGPTTWQWSFGDGSANVTDQNPTHAFPSSGRYNVVLTVTGNNQTNATSQPIDVASGPAPTPGPTATPSLPAGTAVMTLIVAAALMLVDRRAGKK